jgi:hypothetical protein
LACDVADAVLVADVDPVPDAVAVEVAVDVADGLLVVDELGVFVAESSSSPQPTMAAAVPTPAAERTLRRLTARRPNRSQ